MCAMCHYISGVLVTRAHVSWLGFTLRDTLQSRWLIGWFGTILWNMLLAKIAKCSSLLTNWIKNVLQPLSILFIYFLLYSERVQKSISPPYEQLKVICFDFWTAYFICMFFNDNLYECFVAERTLTKTPNYLNNSQTSSACGGALLLNWKINSGGSGGWAGCPMIKSSVVWILLLLVMLLCPWARHLTFLVSSVGTTGVWVFLVMVLEFLKVEWKAELLVFKLLFCGTSSQLSSVMLTPCLFLRLDLKLSSLINLILGNLNFCHPLSDSASFFFSSFSFPSSSLSSLFQMLACQ